MVLGESTSYGFLLKDRLKDAYPYQLASQLRKDFPNTEFEIINYSHPGQISDSILNIFTINFSKNIPDLVINHFGVNDTSIALNPFLSTKFFGIIIPPFVKKIKTIKLAIFAYLFLTEKNNFLKGEDGHFVFYREELEDYKDHLDWLIHTNENYQEILDSINKYNIPSLMLSYFKAPKEVFSLLEKIHKQNNLHYIDLELEENKGLDLYAKDNWHPNKKGHDFITEKILTVLKSNHSYFFKKL